MRGKKLFARNKPLPSKEDHPPLPCTMVLIPDKLKVYIMDYEIEICKSAIAYKTEGLMALGQQEVILILVINKRAKNLHFDFGEPLAFFRQLHAAAEGGAIVEHGGSTKFGGRGLLGSSAVIYAQAPQGVVHDMSRDFLYMILLYGMEELEALTAFGHLRLLSMLGHANRFYPYPYWSDSRRDPMSHVGVSGSTLSFFPARYFLPGTSSITHFPTRREIILKVEQDSVGDDESEVFLPDKSMLLLPGTIDFSQAVGCYVHVPNSSQPHAITTKDIAPHDMQSLQDKAMACCLVGLVGDQENNTCKMMEDGFSFLITNESWNGFWDSLKNQRDYNMALSEQDMTFCLQWF
jgi:hypothetical protein